MQVQCIMSKFNIFLYNLRNVTFFNEFMPLVFLSMFMCFCLIIHEIKIRGQFINSWLPLLLNDQTTDTQRTQNNGAISRKHTDPNQRPRSGGSQVLVLIRHLVLISLISCQLAASAPLSLLVGCSEAAEDEPVAPDLWFQEDWISTTSPSRPPSKKGCSSTEDKHQRGPCGGSEWAVASTLQLLASR